MQEKQTTELFKKLKLLDSSCAAVADKEFKYQPLRTLDISVIICILDIFSQKRGRLSLGFVRVGERFNEFTATSLPPVALETCSLK